MRGFVPELLLALSLIAPAALASDHITLDRDRAVCAGRYGKSHAVEVELLLAEQTRLHREIVQENYYQPGDCWSVRKETQVEVLEYGQTNLANMTPVLIQYQDEKGLRRGWYVSYDYTYKPEYIEKGYVK